MPEEPVESTERLGLVRGAYDAWSRGDFAAMRAGLAADVELVGHPAVPEPGSHVGPDAVMGWLQGFLEAWGELEAEILALAESGDGVAALVRLTGRGRGSGAPVQGGIDAHLWTIRSGAVERLRILPGDEALALMDLGAAERDVFRLCYGDARTAAEVADDLGIAAAEVEATIADGLGRLAALADR
jgi:ketosteroid isomerase-like protein